MPTSSQVPVRGMAARDRVARLLLAALTLALLPLQALPGSAAPADRPPPKAGKPADRYIVLVRDLTHREAVVRDFRDELRVGRRYGNATNGFAAIMTTATVSALRADPRVASVEPDRPMTLSATQPSVTWGLDRIDQPRRPLDRTYTYVRNGKGVTAYVIDTGVYAAHREFGTRVSGGFSTTGRPTSDCVGHGTHVAGTIGGATYGVAKRVRIIPVRVFDCHGMTSASHVLAGLDFVARHHRRGTPAVANLSLGGPGSRAVDQAVNRLIDRGISVVAAAGNFGANACYSSPARVERVLTVGASSRRDEATSWSNQGPCLDLFAPGAGITSAGTGSRAATQTMSGTSMATPHVTGAVALYLQRQPSAKPAAVARYISGKAIGAVRRARSATVNRLLNVPVRIPTRLTVKRSATSVEPLGQVLVGGKLVNGVSGVAMVRRSVRLEGREKGTTAWSSIGTRNTGSDGAVEPWPHTPTSAWEYRLRHLATASSRAATGRTEVAFTKWSTQVSLTAVVTPDGTELQLTGRLTLPGAPDAVRLDERTLQLTSRPEGTPADPENLTPLITGVDGYVIHPVTPAPKEPTIYELNHPGSDDTNASPTATLKWQPPL